MIANTIRKDKRKYNSNSGKSNKIYLLPIIFIISILPLIMYYHEYDSGLSKYSWFPSNGNQFDIFLYYKQVIFIFVCSVMLLVVIYKLLHDRKKIKFKPIFIPLFLYGALALLSTIFSKYPSFGFKGIYEQFESIFVIIGYCLVVYYALLFIETEEDIKFILHYFLYGILIISIIGVLQATGNDLFATEFGKKLYIPSIFWNNLSSFTFTFGPKRAYMTLYNPNYVGVYIAMILPFIFGLLLTEKRKKQIILYIFTIASLVISLIGSQSKAALIGLVISIIFVVIFFRKYIFRNKKITLSIFSICSVIFILFISFNFKVIKNVFPMNLDKTNYALTDIKTEEFITITYRGNDLKIKLDTSDNSFKIILLDLNNNNITYTQNSETYTITDERFSGILVTPIIYDNVLCTQVNVEGKDWIFTNQTADNTYYFINTFGKLDKINKAESILFNGYESFATGRGYIWSRTLPLLKDNIILGSGADTFALEFPHQDYVNYYNSGFEGQILTKPHSLYLQIAVQSGVISLITFIIFYLMYFVSSFKIYIKGQFDNLFKQVGVSIYVGTIAYIITGISNDSTITIAPVAWALIGIGIACNYKVKEQMKNEVNNNK